MNVIYHDAAIVLVEKNGGLLSVPGRGPAKQDCVVNRIKKRFPQAIKQPAVHRLDMYTTGLMVLALTQEAHKGLSQQFEKGRVIKRYTAILDGMLSKNSGKIVLSFRLDINNRPYQIFDPVNGKEGITLWKKLQTVHGRTRIQFEPLTGRTHQLRLHAAHEQGLDCPIVGDSLYGYGKEGDQMMLHASFLSFTHPVTSERISFSSPPPF